MKRRILSLFYSKEPTIYAETKVYSTVEPKWEIIVPEDTIIAEEVTSVSLDDRIVRYKIWNAGERHIRLTKQECISILNAEVMTPWLWIGGETVMGDIIDMTEKIEEYMVPGNKITLQLLDVLNSSICKWYYMSPKTLKEVDFPTDGIVINATRVEGSSKDL
jgi:hypothetical protein